jgi:hypothetical protein
MTILLRSRTVRQHAEGRNGEKGVVMNANRVLSCALCLFAFGFGSVPSAHSQAPMKMFVSSSVTNAGSLSPDQQKEAAAAAGLLAFEIARAMNEKYPCVQTLTQADVANLLGHERARELLGSGDPETLDRIAGAVGSDYLVSVTVTAMGPGKYAFNGTMMNERTAKTEARSGTGPNSGDLVDAIDAFANQFTASLASLSKFSKDKCTPTHAWIGTITYKRDKHETLRPAAQTDSKNQSMTETTSKINVDISVPWAGPVKTRVDAQWMFHSETIRAFSINCKVPGNWAKTAVREGSTKSVESEEGKATGQGESRVNAFFDGGNFVLQVDFPQVEGTFTHHSNSETSGGCPEIKPNNMNVSSNGPWTSPEIYALNVRVPANPSSTSQSGSYTDSFGGTLKWSLTRTPLKK